MHRVSDSGVYGLQKSILLNAFVEYVRSVLSMVEQDFSYESVFRFLRTGFTEFTRDEIDRLENYVVAVGLRGYKNGRQSGRERQVRLMKKSWQY